MYQILKTCFPWFCATLYCHLLLGYPLSQQTASITHEWSLGPLLLSLLIMALRWQAGRPSLPPSVDVVSVLGWLSVGLHFAVLIVFTLSAAASSVRSFFVRIDHFFLKGRRAIKGL